MQILHKYLFECKVIKKTLTTKYFPLFFTFHPIKHAKKPIFIPFSNNHIGFLAYFISVLDIYTHLTQNILSEKNLQGPDIRLARTYFDFLLSQTGQFQLQCSRQSIDNFQPYLSRLTVFHDTDAHIAFQDLRQLQI